MTTTTLHPLAAAYLDDLRHDGRRLPRSVMRDLLAEVESHLSEATDSGMSDAEVLTVLDRLGDPKEIIAAQQPETALRVRTRGTHEWAAIFLLLFGGLLWGIGWIAGLILLWSSSLWTTRDKLIGTLILPGGLAAAVFMTWFGVGTSTQACVSTNGGPESCTGGPSTATEVLGIALLVVTLLAPIVTSIYLARRAR